MTNGSRKLDVEGIEEIRSCALIRFKARNDFLTKAKSPEVQIHTCTQTHTRHGHCVNQWSPWSFMCSVSRLGDKGYRGQQLEHPHPPFSDSVDYMLLKWYSLVWNKMTQVKVEECLRGCPQIVPPASGTRDTREDERRTFSTQHLTCTSTTSNKREGMRLHAVHFTNDKHVSSVMHTLLTSCQTETTALGLQVNAAPTCQRERHRSGNSSGLHAQFGHGHADTGDSGSEIINPLFRASWGDWHHFS